MKRWIKQTNRQYSIPKLSTLKLKFFKVDAAKRRDNVKRRSTVSRFRIACVPRFHAKKEGNSLVVLDVSGFHGARQEDRESLNSRRRWQRGDKLKWVREAGGAISVLRLKLCMPWPVFGTVCHKKRASQFVSVQNILAETLLFFINEYCNNRTRFVLCR